MTAPWIETFVIVVVIFVGWALWLTFELFGLRDVADSHSDTADRALAKADAIAESFGLNDPQATVDDPPDGHHAGRFDTDSGPIAFLFRDHQTEPIERQG